MSLPTSFSISLLFIYCCLTVLAQIQELKTTQRFYLSLYVSAVWAWLHWVLCKTVAKVLTRAWFLFENKRRIGEGTTSKLCGCQQDSDPLYLSKWSASVSSWLLAKGCPEFFATWAPPNLICFLKASKGESPCKNTAIFRNVVTVLPPLLYSAGQKQVTGPAYTSWGGNYTGGEQKW